MLHPSVPARTLKELVALGKARPELFTFAMGGLGTATHLGIEVWVIRLAFVLLALNGGAGVAAG